MTAIASFSYVAAAAAFLALGVLLMLRRRRLDHGRSLLSASLASCAWSVLVAAQATGTGLAPVWAEVAEIARTGAWSLVVLSLTGNEHVPLPRTRLSMPAMGPTLLLLYAGALVVAVAGPWQFDRIAWKPIMPGAILHVSLAIAGIFLVEKLYRSRAAQGRWALKFGCLGIGAIFVYDFYLYSNAMLFQRIDPAIWAARGIVNALAAPLLAVSIGRSASWSLKLAVSHSAAFHSVALFGSAIYLLAMGAAGYYLSFVGATWGAVMQVGFLFGALILLVTILFSGTFRAWLKVFIGKHFYRYHYDYREEWLRFTRALSADGPDLGVRAIEAVAALVESPGGVLFLPGAANAFEPDAWWHTTPVALSEPAHSPFIRFLTSTHWVIDLLDWTDGAGEVPVPAWLAAFPRRRLVVPLVLQGRLAGFMLLTQPRSRFALNWEVIDLLKIAGSQAASYLAQRDAIKALMVARQFESFNRMSAFVVHDLKNLVAQLSLMTLNAEQHRDNPEFQADMLDTVAHATASMQRLLRRLAGTGLQQAATPVDAALVLRSAVARKAVPGVRVECHVDETGATVVADRERLERVLGHLIQNAVEASGSNAKVSVRLSIAGQRVLIAVVDAGSGMSREFLRDRLFTPFDSTKAEGMGIGVFETREYIAELGGTLEVDSQPGVGTTFRVYLPVHLPAAN